MDNQQLKYKIKKIFNNNKYISHFTFNSSDPNTPKQKGLYKSSSASYEASYYFANFVNELCKQIICENSFNIKNVFEQKIQLTIIHHPNDCAMVSLDVVALYDNIQQRLQNRFQNVVPNFRKFQLFHKNYFSKQHNLVLKKTITYNSISSVSNRRLTKQMALIKKSETEFVN